MPDSKQSSVSIIVAYNEKRVIGKDGKIPWHLPEDLAHFKEVTVGDVVIMGRRTWESLPEKFRPLPDRLNIVITRQTAYNWDPRPQGVANSLTTALYLAGLAHPEGNIWIIGGGQVYREALDHGLVDNVYASEVSGEHEGDTFFPELDPEKWSPVTLKHLDGFRIVKWEKILPKDPDA